MGVSKVVYGGKTIIDITDTTATEETVAEGMVAYAANGEKITGKALVVDSIQAISDAIRLKNDGSTDNYVIADIENAVLNLPFGNIPSYHYAEAGRVVKRLLELKTLYPNNICFGTIADNHVDKATASTMTSARHGAFALEYVGALAQCDFIANLADNIAGSSGIDSENDYANAVYMENAIRYAITSLESFNLIGNHDKSSSTQKLFDLIGKYNNFDDHGTTQIRGYGYKDFTEKKVRVICLNTTDYWNIIGGNGMSYEQKDFLMKSLDLSAKSDYASWTILILSHIPLDYLGGDYNKGSDLKAILKAYNDGTTATISVNSDYARRQNESGKYSGTLTYNYTGKNTPKIINIHGHIHTNKYRKLIFIDDNTELDMWRIATPNSSFNGNASTNRYPESGDYSITTEEANKIKKIAGTKADTSATFYLIDFDSQTVHCVGYGADIDRTVVYKDATIYSIAYNLTDVTASNNTIAIVEGETYLTTLSVDSGYALDVVTVTMGGVDITSTAYSNGVITIANVTGDIVIAATAKDNYVPHWDIADRTAVTGVYETASQAHACVTSRHNYIYGISDQGQIDHRQISDVVVNGNDVTFKSAVANINIGLPYQLEPGASYTVKATASQSARFRGATFDTTGKYVGSLTAGSSGTNLSYTFTANANAGYWTVIMLDVRTAGNTTTFSNISLTKN